MKSDLKKAITLSGAAIASLAACCVLFLSGGCTTTQSRAKFEETVASTNRDTRGSVYYKGRKGGYDYFKVRGNVRVKHVRMAVSESPITSPFDYTSKEEDWRGASFMNLKGEALALAIPRKLNAEQAASPTPLPEGVSSDD